jgi:hypothetical protein
MLRGVSNTLTRAAAAKTCGKFPSWPLGKPQHKRGCGANIRYHRRVGCAVCQRLEAELDRFERTRLLKSQIIEHSWQSVRQRELSRLRGEESDARLALEIARARLNRHKRDKHGVD